MRATQRSWSCRILTAGATLFLFFVHPNENAFADSADDAQLRNCDPYRPEIHQAQALIGQRDLDGAAKILGTILSRDKDNIMGHYLAGTIDLTRPDRATRDRGFQQIQLATSLISTRPALCAEKLRWYSLYISMGALYYDQGDRADAKKYLGMAYDHRANLLKQPLQILYEDLGRLAFSEGDLSSALDYFSEAQKEGSKTAASSIATVKSLQNTVSDEKSDGPNNRR